jgi:hypothetical protein
MRQTNEQVREHKVKPRRGTWPIGLPVVIVYANNTKYSGKKARLIGYEAVTVFGSIMSSPVFQITGSKKKIRGYECWWVEASVAKEADAKG